MRVIAMMFSRIRVATRVIILLTFADVGATRR
jgi:hypothetical protein